MQAQDVDKVKEQALANRLRERLLRYNLNQVSPRSVVIGPCPAPLTRTFPSSPTPPDELSAPATFSSETIEDRLEDMGEQL